MPLCQARLAIAGVLIAFLAVIAVERVRTADAATQEYTGIAAVALQYEGTYQGQCWPWVQRVVLEATGRQMGYDYRLGFFEAGAFEVSVDEARAGDVIQIADDSYTAPDANYDGLHTAIVLDNYGGGVFRVIDSNSQWDGMVRIRDNYSPAASAVRYGASISTSTASKASPRLRHRPPQPRLRPAA